MRGVHLCNEQGLAPCAGTDGWGECGAQGEALTGDTGMSLSLFPSTASHPGKSRSMTRRGWTDRNRDWQVEPEFIPGLVLPVAPWQTISSSSPSCTSSSASGLVLPQNLPRAVVTPKSFHRSLWGSLFDFLVTHLQYQE